jgi:hypothetical protein
MYTVEQQSYNHRHTQNKTMENKDPLRPSVKYQSQPSQEVNMSTNEAQQQQRPDCGRIRWPLNTNLRHGSRTEYAAFLTAVDKSRRSGPKGHHAQAAWRKGRVFAIFISSAAMEKC